MNISDAKLLKSTALFSSCDVSALTKYDAMSAEYETGSEISFPSASLGFVSVGRVQIRVKGGGSLMNEIRAGNFFGAATAFLKNEQISTVTAATKCRILSLSRGELEKIFAEFPQCAVAYAELLSEKILFLNKKVYALTSPDSTGALAALIVELSGGCDTVKINLSAAADRLSIGRATLYRAIAALTGEGLISVDGRNITILDRNRLILRRKK